ncbi:hypothetical protein CROQUDRAFT_674637 [Cronartium quercuum f. sp. fusiforme G11]|uniref:Uncharacterized protein n=1 Tax=Cronartium quercuum f. sp. fusiforme G11 TaxID=708437 RepID=A0A9P6NAK1_9BASI|nr:hypothetical protein CROQUDRAFT_674637 [Cronartium quercuum f. sp. fusiforme G11]
MHYSGLYWLAIGFFILPALISFTYTAPITTNNPLNHLSSTVLNSIHLKSNDSQDLDSTMSTNVTATATTTEADHHVSTSDYSIMTKYLARPFNGMTT